VSPQSGGGHASGTHATQAALVLVVEDYEDTRALLASFLREAGFRVQTANDGVGGSQKAVALKPDLIVMDLGLPALDGLAASRRLKRDERTRRIPVVAMTASGDESRRRRAAEAGCDGFLAKPCPPEAFMKGVRRLVSRPATSNGGE
jgi:two-component system, cell cycle response regulator DivK